MRSTRQILILVVAVSVLVACGHFKAEEEGAEAGQGSSIYDGLVAFYHGPLNHLSAVRRGSCPMHPSCSEYSRQAVAAHGVVIGWIMTMDRLLRCGRNELETAPRIFVDGQWKFYDPLWANDQWWHAPEDDAAHLQLVPKP